jgi:hypothetical protein
MYTGPSVVVNKGGFFSAIVKGVFGTIMVVVVCGTALGLYGLRVIDTQAGSLTHVLAALPEWQKVVPPAILDALNDHRAPEYRRELDIQTRIETTGAERDKGVVVISVKNKGDQVVSLMSLRAVVEDTSDRRLHELPITVATPLMIEGEWRGPLLPGEQRELAQRVCGIVGEAKVATELTELRVWNGPVAKAEATAAATLPPTTTQPAATH